VNISQTKGLEKRVKTGNSMLLWLSIRLCRSLEMVWSISSYKRKLSIWFKTWKRFQL